MPQLTHAIRRENSRSPSSRPLMTTISLASWSAVSIDSVRRRSMPERTMSRSTTTSIVWFFRRSSLMSSSSDRNWPSMRAFEKPRVRSASSSFLNSPLRPAHDRRQHVDALVLRVGHHQVDDAFERLAGDLASAVRAVRHADVGEKQPQVVVDLGDGADGRPRVARRRLLLDGDGRREPLDEVDVRLFHLLEKLAGVGGERLDVAPLALGVNRVEGERRLAGAGEPRDDDEPLARHVRRRCSSGCARGRRARKSSRGPWRQCEGHGGRPKR